jgi:DNA-binding XRE family transcriptional regulator
LALQLAQALRISLEELFWLENRKGDK